MPARAGMGDGSCLTTRSAPAPNFGTGADATTLAGRYTNQVVVDQSGNIVLANSQAGTPGNLAVNTPLLKELFAKDEAYKKVRSRSKEASDYADHWTTDDLIREAQAFAARKRSDDEAMDLRSSAAAVEWRINQLKNRGARVIAYDPIAITNTKKQHSGQIDYAENAHSALKGADCAIIMTEWDLIRKLKAKDFQEYMKTPNIVDARRIYDPEEFSLLNYVSIGLGPRQERNS